MKIYIFIIPFIIYFLSYQQKNTSIIQGKVLFINSNGIKLPIDRAKIYFEKYNKEIFTDSLGLFSLEGQTLISEDTTNLIIEKKGYITKKISGFPIDFMQKRQYQFILTKQVILKCPTTAPKQKYK